MTREDSNGKSGAVNRHVTGRLKEIRKVKRLRVQDIGHRIGLGDSSYSCLENNYYRMNLDTLWRALCALGAKIEDVWPLPATEEPLKEALDGFAEPANSLTCEAVLERVCAVFAVSRAALNDRKRAPRTVEARLAAAAIVRENGLLSLSQLGTAIGRSSSSLSHMLRRGQRKMAGQRFQERLKHVRTTLAQDFPEIFKWMMNDA